MPFVVCVDGNGNACLECLFARPATRITRMREPSLEEMVPEIKNEAKQEVKREIKREAARQSASCSQVSTRVVLSHIWVLLASFFDISLNSQFRNMGPGTGKRHSELFALRSCGLAAVEDT